ncbi:hypothetical protein GCM10028791_36630 [Echinicola sediminis]
MFLFNKFRNSRQEFSTGNLAPEVNWKRFLNTNPVYGAESTAVIDDQGNLYFGSHSGNFYSLDSSGSIRWTFSTREKIYSSPLLVEDKIYFAGGDGFFYCLDLSGQLQWLQDLSRQKGRWKNSRRLNLYAHYPFTYDRIKKKNIIYRSWSSPNFTQGKIFITAYGKGLHCFSPSGELVWSYDLEFPRYQLSGVAIDESDHIYCASRKGYAYKFTTDGELKWKKKIKLWWEPWGNPVICDINQSAFFFYSKGEVKGFITATDYEGNTKWEKATGAIRGSCAISHDGAHLYYCDLQGFIYKLNALDGTTLAKNKLTNVSRGLWITPTLDKKGNILLSTKDGKSSGRLIKLNADLEVIWEFHNNKILSVPVLNEQGDIFIGSWDGYYYSLKTNKS